VAHLREAGHDQHTLYYTTLQGLITFKIFSTY